MLQFINKRHITIEIRERSAPSDKQVTNNVQPNPHPLPDPKAEPVPHPALPNNLTAPVTIHAAANLTLPIQTILEHEHKVGPAKLLINPRQAIKLKETHSQSVGLLKFQG